MVTAEEEALSRDFPKDMVDNISRHHDASIAMLVGSMQKEACLRICHGATSKGHRGMLQQIYNHDVGHFVHQARFLEQQYQHELQSYGEAQSHAMRCPPGASVQRGRPGRGAIRTASNARVIGLNPILGFGGRGFIVPKLPMPFLPRRV